LQTEVTNWMFTVGMTSLSPSYLILSSPISIETSNKSLSYYLETSSKIVSSGKVQGIQL